jgi:hypothetical protein
VAEILCVFAFDDVVVEKTSAFYIHWNQYYILAYLRFNCLHTLGQNLRKQKKYDESSSDSENNKVRKTNTKTAEPLPDGDGNWQNANKHYLG